MGGVIFLIVNTVGKLPTFAQSTIIGLRRFHFRVRNGNGWSTPGIASLQYLQSAYKNSFYRSLTASQVKMIY